MARQYQLPDQQTDVGIDGSGCTGQLLWLLVLGAALAVYLVTGNMLFAAAIPYFHAGSKPYRCGIWLSSVDPIAARGRVCFWFYLALGFWLAALSAFATFLVFLLTDLWIGQPPPMNQLALTMLTLFGAACVGSATGIIAIVLALRNRVRIWANPNVHKRCAGDFRRLGQARHGFNFAFYIVALSLVVPILVSGTGLLMWNCEADRPNEASTFSLAVGFLAFGVAPWVMIAISWFLSSRVVAKTPSDCWS